LCNLNKNYKILFVKNKLPCLETIKLCNLFYTYKKYIKNGQKDNNPTSGYMGVDKTAMEHNI